MKKLLLLTTAAALVTAATVISCSPSVGTSEYNYSYPGCPSGGVVCPNDEALTCGLLDIVNKNNDCASDSDCVASEVTSGCVAILSCDGPPAVNKDKKAAFETAFNGEVAKYCADPSCTSHPGCTEGPRRNVLVCFEGHCARAFRPLDAGFPPDDGGQPYVDAGTSDAGTDGGVDAGVSDAGIDAGSIDAGELDAGIDAGELDAGDGGP